MRLSIGNVILECSVGNIVAQPDVDAVVNAANAELMPGGGVAGAIHAAAGPDLAKACKALAPIHPGQAVITEAFRLPNRFVIHCLGPVYGRDEPADGLLASCHVEALRLAEDYELASIAFPAISTGVFGYPLEEAARVACRSVAREAPGLRSLALVRFVLRDAAAAHVFDRALAAAVAEAQGREGP